MTAVTPLCNRGQTYLSGNPDRTLAATMQANLEGSRFRFDDIDPTATSGAKTVRSGRQVTCVLVRNELATGLAVDGKRVVKWKAGQIGRQIDGYCCITDELCAGITDEWLGSAGCPLHDLFWLTIEGPTLVLNPRDATNCNWSAGDRLSALTAVTSGSTTAGRPFKTVFTGSTAAQCDAVMNNFAIALSAVTTALTTGSCLVHCHFLKT